MPSSVNQLLYDVVEPGGGSMPWFEDLPAVVQGPASAAAFRVERAAGGELGGVRRDDGRRWELRDKLLITVLALTGLRIGQALGLRRSDMHLMDNSRAVGCSCPGPHVHVVRREDNENLALSKRRRELVVPGSPVGSWRLRRILRRSETACRRRARRISCSSTSAAERSAGRCATAARARWSARSAAAPGSSRVVTPHQFRHGLATEMVESGRSLDEVQMILGHAQVETTRRYTHTSRARLREAIESVALPSAIPAGST